MKLAHSLVMLILDDDFNVVIGNIVESVVVVVVEDKLVNGVVSVVLDDVDDDDDDDNIGDVDEVRGAGMEKVPTDEEVGGTVVVVNCEVIEVVVILRVVVDEDERRTVEVVEEVLGEVEYFVEIGAAELGDTVADVELDSVVGEETAELDCVENCTTVTAVESVAGCSTGVVVGSV